MCYSAQIERDFRRYVRAYGVDISLKEFVDLFWRRVKEPRLVIPKAVEAFFTSPDVDVDGQIRAAVAEYRAALTSKLEEEIFAQRRRLADAERKLAAKPTKGAADDRRIATGKVDRALEKLADLRRTDLTDEDARIFPGTYAPVIVMEHGRRVLKPMRYQCRVPGKPASYDVRFPGTYNARIDNLEGFWRDLFGRTHGILVANAFFEHVKVQQGDEAGKSIVLEFRPKGRQTMLIACLWSRWTAPGEADLLSFAAITDEPPPEVAAAGHDRCIIPIRPESMDAWLNPDPGNLTVSYAVLKDRERPYYEHALAA